MSVYTNVMVKNITIHADGTGTVEMEVDNPSPPPDRIDISRTDVPKPIADALLLAKFHNQTAQELTDDGSGNVTKVKF